MAPSNSTQFPYTEAIVALMQRAGVPSFLALSRQAQVSVWQVEQLRRGKLGQMRLETLQRLSQALQTPLLDLLRLCGVEASESTPTANLKGGEEGFKPPSPYLGEGGLEDEGKTCGISGSGDVGNDKVANPEATTVLQAEYQRLQARLHSQTETLQQEFQQTSLAILESWLIQWPTIAYAVQQNPQLPASKVLPLVRPVEQLVSSWGVVAIAPVGAEVPFDPQAHQLMEGMAEPGDRVRVRYTGYRQGDRLLYRAKVSPVV